METWKDIPGYEGIYQASTHGRIRSAPGKTTHSVRHGIRKWQTRIMKPKTKTSRAIRVTLWKDKQSKDYLVHRLVATTFLPKPDGKDCINHKDGNPKNNNITNLEWCDHRENSNHAFDTGLMTSNKKTKLWIDGKQHEFRSMSKASEYLGFNHGAISVARYRGRNTLNGIKFEVQE